MYRVETGIIYTLQDMGLLLIPTICTVIDINIINTKICYGGDRSLNWDSGRKELAVSAMHFIIILKQKLKTPKTKSPSYALLLVAWSTVGLDIIPSSKPVKEITRPAHRQRREFKLLAAQESTTKSRESKHLQSQQWCKAFISASGGRHV